jgi:hypothetical protein
MLRRTSARHVAPAVLVGLCAFGLADCGSAKPTTGPSPSPSPSIVHLYPAYGVDPSVLCARPRIKIVYFVPRGEEAEALPTWKAEAARRFGEIRAFFGREFAGQVDIRFDIAPQIVVGRKARYTQSDDVTAEVESALFSPGGRAYDPAFAAGGAGEYVVRMIYYLNLADGKPAELPGGGAYPLWKIAMNPAFWLDPEGEDAAEGGTVNSAHEFGHLLGMPHPWEMNPPQADSPGNLMGYTTAGFTLAECHIADDVKLAMGMHR